MYYIFHGDDDFTLAEELEKLRAKMGDPQFAELNTTVLDGRYLTVGQLRHHTDAIPFLSDKRLVIVEGMLARLDAGHKKKEDDEAVDQVADPELAASLAEYLQGVPDSTRLVFVERKALGKTNPILKSAEKDKKLAHVRLFRRPSQDDLLEWIVDRAEIKGGRIEPSAANELGIYVGGDLRALDNELEKLITYRRLETIRREDVQALVSPVQEQSIFELVDALGQRNTVKALKLLHEQFDHNRAPQYVFPMIIRQFRLLLQVRDLASRGSNVNQIREQLGMHPFVAPKVYDQARNFSIEQLERIYGKLLDVDIGMKTSRGDPAVALDTLILELTKPQLEQSVQ